MALCLLFMTSAWLCSACFRTTLVQLPFETARAKWSHEKRPGKSHATWNLGWLRTRVFISWARYPKKKNKGGIMPYMYTSCSTNQTVVHYSSFIRPGKLMRGSEWSLDFVHGACIEIYTVPKGTSTNQRKLMKSRNCQRKFDTIAAIAWYLFESYSIQRNFIDAQKSPQWIVHLYSLMIIWSKSSWSIYRVPGRATFFMFLELEVKSFSGPYWVQWTKLHDTTSTKQGHLDPGISPKEKNYQVSQWPPVYTFEISSWNTTKEFYQSNGDSGF